MTGTMYTSVFLGVFVGLLFSLALGGLLILSYQNWIRAIRAEAMSDAHEANARLYKIIGETLVAQQPSAALSEARIMALLKLSHPDRHKNNALSTETTAWLLEERRKIEERRKSK